MALAFRVPVSAGARQSGREFGECGADREGVLRRGIHPGASLVWSLRDSAI
jgi:hypothetical protein